MHIESYEFGSIVIQGQSYTRDVQIVPGRVIPQWWRKNGHHVVLEDIPELLRADPERIVFGTGKPGLMRVSSDLRDFLQQQCIGIVEQPTAVAVETVNTALQAGRRFAAGLHLSC